MDLRRGCTDVKERVVTRVVVREAVVARRNMVKVVGVVWVGWLV
jgi:hypothetical protein